jgi:hypothetical protein
MISKSIEDGEYEEAVRDTYEKGLAMIEEAVKRGEERRRFYADSHGCMVVAYADPEEREA